MNRAIYYRQCGGGQYSNYIYFWGLQDSNESYCFKSDYPTMFEIANGNKNNPVTAAKMSAVYDGKSGLSADSQQGYALGNAMAAILISESARDYLVILENFMLMDFAAAKKPLEPKRIIGGHCIPNASSCQNRGAKQNGEHPLAWGGAQSDMMAGDNWGVAAGATSQFGMAYEGRLVTRWAREFAGVSKANADKCSPPQSYNQLTQAQKAYLDNLFAPLLR
ncbi:hypothetical protein WI85_11930 [Burkholderia ubonensis]|nr:hypothetical protein WI85_11930 [Burkholderia ubonensis]